MSSVLSGQLVALERPPFGHFARQRARLSPDAIAACLADQRERGGKLGELLVQRGFLTDDERQIVLQDQARWVALAAGAAVGSGLPYPATLSLCMPAYNEAENIVDTLEAACAILPEMVADFEVIVVNDGSRDRTGELVRQFAARDARVKLVEHDKNRGYGAAVRTGLQAASGELVMMMDSDGQFNLLDLPPFLAAIDQHDTVVGYRYDRAEKGVRRFNAWAWTRLIRFLLKVPIRDLDCAFKLFRREVVDELEFTSTGAVINAEIMTQCFGRGRRVCELPVNHYPCYFGEQTGANLRVIARAFKELPRLRRYHARRMQQHRAPTPPQTAVNRNFRARDAVGHAHAGHGSITARGTQVSSSTSPEPKAT